jgi:queuosine precursor transporter
MLTIAILTYAAAMTLANLSVATWGPWVSPINAFMLIGLDLALRDWLHVRLKAWQMLALIVAAGALTYLLNPASGKIAVASSVAFTAAALVDWATFARLRGTWLFRANGSNVAGAAVDSLIFPTLAFGVLMPHIVALQFVAKVAGGAIWAFLLQRMTRTNALV